MQMYYNIVFRMMSVKLLADSDASVRAYAQLMLQDEEDEDGLTAAHMQVLKAANETKLKLAKDALQKQGGAVPAYRPGGNKRAAQFVHGSSSKSAKWDTAKRSNQSSQRDPWSRDASQGQHGK